MKLTIFKCDICGNETDPDIMLHTEEHDVCVGCLEKLVNKHFAKMEEILESACAKEPLPSNRPSPGRPTIAIDQGEASAIKADRVAGMAIKDIAKKHHRGVEYINKVLERVPDKATSGKKETADWGKAQALRAAGWSIQRIANELGVSAQSVYNHTHPVEAKPTPPHEWTEAGLRRTAETNQEEIEELMHNG